MNINCKEKVNNGKASETNRFFGRLALVALTLMFAPGFLPAQSENKIPETISFDGIRDKQFCEILVVKEDGVDVYNTAINECREAAWNRLNREQIQQQFGAKAVQKNGPYFWMMDAQDLSLELLGEKVSIGGLDVRRAGTLDPSILSTTENGVEPYKVFTPKKTLPLEKMRYDSQKPVFELIDPDGHTYILQARHEKCAIESLATLGDKLKKLPDGWQYRTRTLTENMVLKFEKDKPIFMVGDEFHQNYIRIAESK